MMNRRRALLCTTALCGLAGCATMPGHDPVQVTVVNIDPIEGESLELRFLCKLRLQNPNDSAIAFRGAVIDLQVRGTTLAYGVSDVEGTVPPFGEALVEVPVTVSALRVARQAIGMAMGDGLQGPIDYVLLGKLGGPMFGTVRFESRGVLNLGAKKAGAGGG